MAYKYSYNPQAVRGDKDSEKKGKDVHKYLAIAFAACIFLAIVFYYANIVLPYQILRAALGLLFVLFFPGYIASYALFRDIDFVERIALSIMLSISLVVLTIMFSNLALKVPINFDTIVIQISAVSALFLVMDMLPDVRQAVTAQRKTSYAFSGIGKLAAMAIILGVILIYHYFVAPSQIGVQDMKLSDLYNSSMTVMDFYPQQGLTMNLTGVSIPETSVVAFGGKVALLSHSINSTELRPGDYFHVTYYWKILNNNGNNYSAEVNITYAAGMPFFNQDHSFPTVPRKGDIIMEEYDVKVPKIANGTYLISIGLSEAEELLPVTSGASVGGQNAIIGTINVTNSLNFSDLYNAGMTVHRYPQKLNETGIMIQNPQAVNFDNSIALLGYSINATNISAGETFHITYFWKSLDKVNINYTAFVHFTDSAGAVMFQQDHSLPVKTSFWSKGDIISEEYDVKAPETPGDYEIRIGLYDQYGTGQRMPILSGPTDLENRAIIGDIIVK